MSALAYAALAVSDLSRAARFLEEGLGLRPQACRAPQGRQVPLYPVGRSALALLDLADPFLGEAAKPGVHHIAIASADPAAEAAARGFAPAPGEGLDGRRQAVVDPRATLGVRIRYCEPLSLAPPAPTPIERIDHLGVASADNGAAVELFAGRLGFPLESRQTDMEVQTVVESFTSDKYGVLYHSRPPVPVGGLRVAFISVGDAELEFLENFDPRHAGEVRHGTAGTTRQDQGAITRYIARRGPGLHHVALKTPDINGLLASLQAAGYPMIDAVGRPGSRRALIGFAHPEALGGVLAHFVERPEL